MAIARMTTADNYAVGPAFECLHHEQRVHPAAAIKADDAYIWRHLQAAGPGQIRARVCAPVTHKGDNLWFVSSAGGWSF
jgi:hypothetical protein